MKKYSDIGSSQTEFRLTVGCQDFMECEIHLLLLLVENTTTKIQKIYKYNTKQANHEVAHYTKCKINKHKTNTQSSDALCHFLQI